MAWRQRNRFLQVSTPLGEDAVQLVAFSGVESLSNLFDFQLELISERKPISPAQLVGQPVSWSVETTDGPRRFFHGRVAAMETSDYARRDETTRTQYRLAVVPWFAFLRNSSDCRIFQNMTVGQIVQQVFDDRGYQDYELRIGGADRKRDYCVQYNESHFAFVSRLLEEEGFLYYFRHENNRHVMVIGDGSSAYFDCEDKNVDFPSYVSTRVPREHVTRWNHRYELRSGAIAHTDYNPDSPDTNLSKSASSKSRLARADASERFGYPGRYQEGSDGQRVVQRRMEGEDAAHDYVEGESLYKSLGPGGRFSVKSHPLSDEVGRKYVIRRITHQAIEPNAYETGGGAATRIVSADTLPREYLNKFECIPAEANFRPPRETPRPRADGPQTAVVVGPRDEEIYVDKQGRVKVQFPWDRRGKRDENSSCWVRVSQGHAGRGFGHVNLPRIGEEVLVGFLDADPDRPVVINGLYNGKNHPPYPLPDQKTKSGVKSKTYRGDGYNQLFFEDRPGHEQIIEDAERDKESTIRHDFREHVGNDRIRDVGRDEQVAVTRNATLTIDGGRRSTIGQDDQLKAGKSIVIDAGDAITIRAGTSLTLQVGNAYVKITKDGAITLSAKRITIDGSDRVHVRAAKEIVIKGQKVLQN